MDMNDLKWFMDTVNMGDDIVFCVGKKQYWVGTYDGGKHIISQNPDGPDTYFCDAEDLLTNFLIDGLPLGKQLDKIEITNA
ncbi:MAG: hypothetical protein WDA65_02485 [Christensenellales bacterium]